MPANKNNPTANLRVHSHSLLCIILFSCVGLQAFVPPGRRCEALQRTPSLDARTVDVQ